MNLVPFLQSLWKRWQKAFFFVLLLSRPFRFLLCVLFVASIREEILLWRNRRVSSILLNWSSLLANFPPRHFAIFEGPQWKDFRDFRCRIFICKLCSLSYIFRAALQHETLSEVFVVVHVVEFVECISVTHFFFPRIETCCALQPGKSNNQIMMNGRLLSKEGKKVAGTFGFL